MKRTFLILALAAALALSFALAGCSNSGPKSGPEPGDVVENMDAGEKADSAADKASEQPQPGFDIELAVFDNGLGEFVDYYPVEGENGEIYWGVVTHDVNGDEVTTYFDNKGNMTEQMERGDIIE